MFPALGISVVPRQSAVGFSAGAWVTLSVAEPNSFKLFVPHSNLRFQAAGCVLPSMSAGRGASGDTHGHFYDWTPAADCSNKIAAWGNDGPPIELLVYPGAHHSFYYPQLQPGRTIFGHWLEYNEAAATDATRRMREFLKRHLT
jgi:dienelactone hydrolase